MEDRMTKEETYDTHVYVEGRQRPLPVGMYTDEHSEICSIRFSNSFTLNVVSPQDLIALAQELDTFAKRAYELHYPDPGPSVGESIAQLQEKLEGLGVVEPVDEAQINRTRARYLREEESAEDDFVQEGIDAREQQKAARMMKGTVSAGDWKDPSDPVNW
tara:strand:- start:550 stop:1029 length:480 start_codon:yes stop_codon:yes gene_type:complete